MHVGEYMWFTFRTISVLLTMAQGGIHTASMSIFITATQVDADFGVINVDNLRHSYK